MVKGGGGKQGGCLLETVKEATTNTQTLYYIICPEYALSICFAAILFLPLLQLSPFKYLV